MLTSELAQLRAAADVPLASRKGVITCAISTGPLIYFTFGEHMAFWRMQLHPSDSAQAVSHTMKSLGLGYIGLDFADPPGDLTDVDRGDIQPGQRDYWEFAHTMARGDIVLIIAHHYPCALVRVVGDYNYIRAPHEELQVWFRHFRRIEVVGYYADLVLDPAKWEKTRMTDTISALHTSTGTSYRLIERWLASAQTKASGS